MTKIRKPAYLAKVKRLTKEETERLLSRMGGKLDRRLGKEKLSKEEALAIQMELEDEKLREWRKVMNILKDKDKAKDKEKSKNKTKAKIPKARKPAVKSKPPSKTKVKQVK
jgi:hypothetical protein